MLLAELSKTVGAPSQTVVTVKLDTGLGCTTTNALKVAVQAGTEDVLAVNTAVNVPAAG